MANYYDNYNYQPSSYKTIFIDGCEIKIGNWSGNWLYNSFGNLVLNGGYTNLFVDRLGTFDRIRDVWIEYDQPNVNPIVKTSNLTRRKSNELQGLIEDLEESGHLRLSESQWSSPVSLNYGKGYPDIKVDYSELNHAMNYSGPYRRRVPKMKNVLGSITQSNLFSKIVVKNGFHQISLGPNSAWWMAFRTKDFNTFEFTTLHDGMKDADLILQGVMEYLLADIDDNLKKFIKIYKGQILVHTQNDGEHFELLDEIMAIFEENNVKIDIEESVFLAWEVTYLGSVIDENGRHINPTEITKFQQFKQPTDLSGVRSFLSSVGYHKDNIEINANFDYLTEPLRRLISNGRFYWFPEQKKAFNRLRNQVINSDPIPLIPLEVN